MSTCEFCDAIMVPGERNCPGCGAAASTWSEAAASPSVVHHHHHSSDPQLEGVSPKSKLAAGLFGLLLGGFGIHNFYLGFTGKGLAQVILTFLGCAIPGLIFVPWIWGFIEGILILAGNPKDAKGLPLV